MTPPPPLRMRLVPAEPTEEMHDDEAVAETFQRVWSAEYKRSMALYGTPAFASYSFTKPMWSAMLDAAPSSGRVSREAVERAIRRSYEQLARTPISDEMWSEHWLWYLRGKGKGQSADYSNVAEAERHALGTIAALGLEMEGDDAAPR